MAFRQLCCSNLAVACYVAETDPSERCWVLHECACVLNSWARLACACVTQRKLARRTKPTPLITLCVKPCDYVLRHQFDFKRRGLHRDLLHFVDRNHSPRHRPAFPASRRYLQVKQATVWYLLSALQSETANSTAFSCMTAGCGDIGAVVVKTRVRIGS